MRPVATMRSLRAARPPSITPSSLMMPARNISPIASMMPEPQMPVTPTSAAVAREFRLVGPVVAADHLDLRLERDGIDPDALDRARRRALAAGNLRALEGRAGRGGRRRPAASLLPSTISALVPTSTSSVISSPRCGPSDSVAPAAVGADMPGNAGEGVDARALVDRQTEIAGAEVQRSETASANGAPPSSVGSMPRKR